MYPQRIRGGAGYFPEEGKVVLEGYFGAEVELTEGNSTSPNGNSEPDTIVMTNPGDVQCFMATNDYEDVTDRFEHISGIYHKGIFHLRVRTIADKMSMREGLFMVIPNKIPDELWGGFHGLITGEGKILSPRQPDWPKRYIQLGWHEGPDGRYAVIFDVLNGENGQLLEMKGYSESSNDVPWNWHYGFEIQGSIPVIP